MTNADQEPKNVGERLISRRLELDLNQAQVAEQITFWNDHRGEWVELSRSAYCMYESGDVVPDLFKIEQIARVLACSPAWLAFGSGPNPNQVDVIVELGTADGLAVPAGEYWLDARYRRDVLQISPVGLGCIRGAPQSSGLELGEVALFATGKLLEEVPTYYAYFADGVGHVGKLSRIGGNTVTWPDDRRAQKLPGDAILLGRIASILKKAA